MVRTGSSTYVKYGWESSYGGTATIDKKFGLQDSLSSWTLTHNRMDLPALNQLTVDEYAYGQQQGSIGVDFTLSNPWIFKSILGTASDSGSSDPYTHTFPHATNGINKTPTTFSVEVGFDDSTNIVRTLKGCVTDSLAINTSVGDLVSATISATYGKEDAPSTSLSAPSKPVVEFPYTFAHARLKWSGSTVAQVQDLSLTIAQNTTLLYGLNSHQAVDSYRQLLDITGSFRASLVNKDLLENMLEQVKAGSSSGTYSSTVGGSPELEILFSKDSGEEIKITGTGLAPSDLAWDGIRPNEPVFENVNWRFKSITIAAKNNQSAAE